MREKVLVLAVCCIAYLMVLPAVSGASGTTQRAWTPGCHPGHSCSVCRDLPRAVRRWCPAVRYYWQRWHKRYCHHRVTTSELHRSLEIMWRESRGIPTARNGAFHGLYQIWYKHAPQYNLFKPMTNISVAGQLFARCNWAPWQ